MIEKSADEFDVASQLADQANEQARLRMAAAEALRIRRTQIAINDGDFDGIHCVEPDCGVELPATRVANHCMRCTACETRLEKQNKLRGR